MSQPSPLTAVRGLLCWYRGFPAVDVLVCFVNMALMVVNTLKLILLVTILLSTAGLVAREAFAKPEGGTRPGWGYGDKNHEHTGPPGLSENPGLGKAN